MIELRLYRKKLRNEYLHLKCSKIEVYLKRVLVINKHKDLDKDDIMKKKKLSNLTVRR